MRISFERSGGFAGITIKREFDLDDLPADVADALKDNLEAANFFSLPNRLASESVIPDSFSYVITVEDDEGTHTVSFSEDAITDTLRPLVDQLWQMTRPHK